MLPQPDPTVLTDLLHYTMPYGKYKGTLIRRLPTYYLEWFAKTGFPKNRIGVLLETMHVIRQENLDFLLDSIPKRG